MKNHLLFFFVIGTFLIAGCNDDSVIGEDLLDDQEIEVAFDDNFVLKAQTIRGDSVQTFRRSVFDRTYLLGTLDDPVFGKSTSDIYTGFSFSTDVPDYTNSEFDSLVLELEYDTIGFYGDRDASFKIEVFRVTEDWLERDSIYSTESFMTEMTPIATVNKVIDPEEDLFIIEHEEDGNDTIVELQPRLRIRLDDAFGEELLMNEDAAESDSALIANFKGFYIKATVDNSIIAFNFSEDPNVRVGRAGMTMYYTENDGDKSEYEYLLSTETYSNFSHEYQGSEIESYLNDTLLGDEFVFVQNMAGVNAELILPDLSQLENTLINAAQIEFTVVEGGEGFLVDEYPFSTRYLMSKYDNDGERVIIDDLIKGNLPFSSTLDIHDGQIRTIELEDESEIMTVKFNITDYIRGVIDSGEERPRLIISPVERQESPRRVVFYGPNHSEFPAKLRIAYTTI